ASLLLTRLAVLVAALDHRRRHDDEARQVDEQIREEDAEVGDGHREVRRLMTRVRAATGSITAIQLVVATVLLRLPVATVLLHLPVAIVSLAFLALDSLLLLGSDALSSGCMPLRPVVL